MNISFIGYRGTGKTTVSRLLSKKLNWQLMDSDEIIQLRTGNSIAQIFKVQGEEYFRDLEESVIQELLNRPEDQIISTGGGAILRPQTRSNLREKSLVIWLKASDEVIYQRIYKDRQSVQNRPALTEMTPLEEIRHILKVRTPLYEECAKITIDTDQLEPVDIVQLLLMDPVMVSSLGGNL